MKGLAAFADVSIFLGLGASARGAPTENDRTRLQAAAPSPATKGSRSRPERRALLGSDTRGLIDDALDAKGSVSAENVNGFQTSDTIDSNLRLMT